MFNSISSPACHSAPAPGPKTNPVPRTPMCFDVSRISQGANLQACWSQRVRMVCAMSAQTGCLQWKLSISHMHLLNSITHNMTSLPLTATEKCRMKYPCRTCANPMIPGPGPSQGVLKQKCVSEAKACQGFYSTSVSGSITSDSGSGMSDSGSGIRDSGSLSGRFT